MRTLLADLQRACADYEVPSNLETTGSKRVTRVSAKTGRSYGATVKTYRGYRRTNTLKKSWSRGKATWQGSSLVGEVKSSGQIAPYNKWVRSPDKQAKHMKARGWKTTKQIMAEYWPQASFAFQRILKGKSTGSWGG